jgi:hypothetical protein
MFYMLLAEAKQTCSSVKFLHRCLNKSRDSKQVLYRLSYYQMRVYRHIFLYLQTLLFQGIFIFFPLSSLNLISGQKRRGTRSCVPSQPR